MEGILLGVEAILNFKTLFILFIGVFFGVIIGAIPGFTIAMGVVLALPFSYGMDPINGIALLIGVQVGGNSGGLITACLLGIPGTPSAVATTFDGYPMSRNGEPGRALALGLWASFIGTIISGIILIILAPMLAKWALAFGPWEHFALMVFGLCAVATLNEGPLVKGLLSVTLGILISFIGIDPLLGIERFTYGFRELKAGLHFLPVLIGIFAFSQLLGDLNRDSLKPSIRNLTYPRLKLLKDLMTSKINLIRSALIGVFVGILPGAGGSIANILSYDQAKRFSKRPDKYGTGIKEGIIASETANNSSQGGALIPMMAFGIPGDATIAMLMGALMIHGIQPGPLFIDNSPALANGIYIAFLFSAVFMLLIQSRGIPLFLLISRISAKHLTPTILVFCAIGSFSVNNRLFDVWVLFIFGIIGYWMTKSNIPLAPFILGVILGPITEKNFQMSLSSDPNLLLFLTRPISGGLILLSVVLFIYPLIKKMLNKRRELST